MVVVVFAVIPELDAQHYLITTEQPLVLKRPRSVLPSGDMMTVGPQKGTEDSLSRTVSKNHDLVGIIAFIYNLEVRNVKALHVRSWQMPLELSFYYWTLFCLRPLISYRSKSITLAQALTKSLTNFCCASPEP